LGYCMDVAKSIYDLTLNLEVNMFTMHATRHAVLTATPGRSNNSI
jgi:hypothetical protein